MVGMKEKDPQVSKRQLHVELAKQMSMLSTAGFGLVAALAWNDAIQSFVSEFIETRIPGSGLAYKFLYAAVITVFSVLVTYQVSRVAARFEPKQS